MPERLLQLDDLRNLTSPEKIATLFGRLGYNAEAQPLHVEDLQLTARSAETVDDAYSDLAPKKVDGRKNASSGCGEVILGSFLKLKEN
jgi:hypothetical protein